VWWHALVKSKLGQNMLLRSYSAALDAAVNDNEVLCNNFTKSPMLSEDCVHLKAGRGYQSPAKASNEGVTI